MVQQQKAASFAPDDMVEGGGPPIQQNLHIKEARIAYFDYQGKAPQTVASKLTLVDDNGQTSTQHYSIGDPTRFAPSQDGKKVMLMGQATGISKNSNHGILMTALVNAGFPVERLADGDLSVLDGLYAYWDGVPEPSRPGLTRTEAQRGRQNVIAVPMQIHRFPWDAEAGPAPAPTATAPPIPNPGPGGPPPAPLPVAGGGGPPAPVAPAAPAAPTAPAAAPSPNGAVDLNGLAMGLVSSLGNQFTLQQAMGSVYSTYPEADFRDPLATYIFSPEFTSALEGVGYQVAGHNITR
jgi:hypothetical protein